jgi:hypothetical protein
MAATWNGTAANELLSGAALRDGASVTSAYTVDVTIPAGDDATMCDSQYIADHTNAAGMGSTANNCPDKNTFFSQF